MALIFVYGTLRTGQSNHRRLLSGRRSAAATLAGHRLRAGTFPWIEPHPGGLVVGEVVEVDDHELGVLDRLEDVAGGLYRRVEATVEVAPDGLETAWVWVGGTVAKADDPVMDGGDWTQAYAWYVAYGSNLCRDRFLLYLVGGPHPVTGAQHVGARDPAPPRADRPFPLDHAIRFARSAPSWGGGGCAFLDPEPGSGRAHGRAWLIRREQLADVLAQEAGCRPPPLEDDVLRASGPTEIAPLPSWYGLVVPLGELDGWPAVTFTAADAASHPPSAPSAAYRDVVLCGLTEIGVDHDAAVAYVDAASR